MSRPRDAVTVTGHGSATGVPDLMVATMGCEASAPDVAGALTAAWRAAEAMRAALGGAGVAGADLRTADSSVRQEWTGKERPEGFLAQVTFVAALRDLDAAGAVVAAAVAAAGDAGRLHGVQLVVEDQGRLLRQARQEAFADARGKAEQYAALAGRALGAVLAVDDAVPGPQPRVRHGVMPVAAGGMPVEPGSAELTASVTVRWELA